MANKEHIIFTKGLQLFTKNGYDHTPLSQIAKAVGMTKAGLYHYFQSKEDLLFAIHKDYLEKNFDPILSKTAEIDDSQERITYFVREYVDLLTRDPSPKVLIHEARRLKPKHQEIIKASWKKAFDLLKSALNELKESGECRDINSTYAAFAVIGMCSWIFYWYDYSRKEPNGALGEAYSEILFDGVLSKGKTKKS